MVLEHHRGQHTAVVLVDPAQAEAERRAAHIRDEVALRARLASVRRVRTRRRAPFLAGTEALSRLARLQSIYPADEGVLRFVDGKYARQLAQGAMISLCRRDRDGERIAVAALIEAVGSSGTYACLPDEQGKLVHPRSHLALVQPLSEPGIADSRQMAKGRSPSLIACWTARPMRVSWRSCPDPLRQEERRDPRRSRSAQRVIQPSSQYDGMETARV